MKKIFTLVVMVVVVTSFSFAQLTPNHTYYYELVANVSKEGKRTAVSGDGHYLTMNNKYLYESNAQGHTLSYGMLTYINSANGFPTYEGKSYLGKDLTYRFAADFSRLNVLLYDGTVLVYERRNKPNASNMRKYASSNSDGGGYVNYGTGLIDGGTNSSGTTENNRRNSNDDYYEYQCGFCNGTGRVTINRSKNMGNFGVGKVEKVRCYECGKEYDSNGTVHRHETCSKCNGKGKIRERLR